MDFLRRLFGKKQPTVTSSSNVPKRKMECNKCGGKMTIATGGVVVLGGSPGPSPMVKLRCEKCNITRFENRDDIEKDLAEHHSPAKKEELPPIDLEAVKSILGSPPTTAGFARFRESSGDAIVGVIIHEDERHIRRLPDGVSLDVRSGLFVRSNVGLVTVMLGVAGEIYETWWNFHVPVIQQCFYDVIRQERLPVVFYCGTADPARLIWTHNVLRDRFAAITKSLQEIQPWTMDAFDMARNQLYREYPTPQALWGKLTLGIERRE